MSVNPYTISPAELELIEGCQKGKAIYQEKLYKTFAPKMYAVCIRYSNSIEDAQDLLQEGFIKVYNYINKYRKEGSFEGWIRRIFVNTAIEYYRKSSNMYSVVELKTSIAVENVDESAISQISSAELLKMVQQLSPGYRTIFNLYAIEGYNHKEIGELLGISEGTSKSQLARARMLLQKMLIAAQSFRKESYVECI